MIDLLLQQYQNLLNELDAACKQCLQDRPQIPCRKGCDDCCKQLFPLSIIEAFYINEGFKSLDRKKRRELQLKAERASETLNALDLLQYETSSNSLEEIVAARNNFMRALQSTSIHCPLLENSICQLYKNRNHDCRIHGVGFDHNNGEIIGCFRHQSIFTTPELKTRFAEKAVPSNHLYKEKSKLDSLLLTELGKNPEYKYIYYITTPYKPLIEDFRAFNWPKFLEEKTAGHQTDHQTADHPANHTTNPRQTATTNHTTDPRQTATTKYSLIIHI